MTLALVSTILFSGCAGKAPVTSEPESISVAEVVSETPEVVSEEVPEEPEEVFPDPVEPVAVFTGDPEKVILFDENTYYEADKFFIYFGKDAKVRDDTIENLTKVMCDVEDLFGLSYDTDRVMDEDDWRNFYYGGSFEYVNPKNGKPNILILPDPKDDTVEWAYQNTVMLYDSSLDPNGQTYDTTYHELTHLLFARQCGSLGQVIDEGTASYAQYHLSKKDNFAAWSTIQFLDYNGYSSTYDDSGIYADPEAEFLKSLSTDRDGRQINYQYGFRFVTFLMEQYGPDIMAKICDTANAHDLDNGNKQTGLLVNIIKEATSDDVFTEFKDWLPDGWNEFGRDYTEYMKQFGF